MIWRAALFLGIVGGIIRVTAAQSVDDIRADVDRQEYRAALQKISKALPAAKNNAEMRYDLLMLRGEAMVQLRQKPAAIEAFRSASKALGADADLGRALAARAMLELLTGSDGWTYRPGGRGAGGGGAAGNDGIDIINPASRAKAMAAMFDDRLIATTPKIDAARDARNLAPMIELMPTLGALMALEYGATGENAKMLPFVESLGERSRDLITLELDRLDFRISELEDAANDLFFLDNTNVGIPARRGLHSDEAQELADMQDYVDRIGQSAEECRRINRRLGGTGEVWDDVLLRTSEVKARAKYVLAAQGQGLRPNR